MADESSLIDILKLGDTNQLQNKYYDYLNTALSPQQTVQPDNGALFMQGVLPTVLGALFTKGKSLGASADPLKDVYKREYDKAETNKKLDLETKLKGAGLIQDTLQAKQKLVADEFDRAQRREDKKQSDAQLSQYRQDTLDVRREAIAASRDSSANAAAARKDQQDFQHQYQNDRLGDSESAKINTIYQTKVNQSDIPKKWEAIGTAENILAKGKLGPSDLQGLKDVLTVALRGARPSQQTIAAMIPQDRQSAVTGLLNAVTSGAEDPLSTAKRQDVADLVRILKSGIKERVVGIKREISGSAPSLASYLHRSGNLKGVLDPLGGEYGADGAIEDSIPIGSTGKAKDGSVVVWDGTGWVKQ